MAKRMPMTPSTSPSDGTFITVYPPASFMQRRDGYAPTNPSSSWSSSPLPSFTAAPLQRSTGILADNLSDFERQATAAAAAEDRMELDAVSYNITDTD